jgi:hypothetical protein
MNHSHLPASIIDGPRLLSRLSATERIKSNENTGVYYLIESMPVTKYLEDHTGSIHMKLIDAQFHLPSMNNDTQ